MFCKLEGMIDLNINQNIGTKHSLESMSQLRKLNTVLCLKWEMHVILNSFLDVVIEFLALGYS